MRPLSLNLSLWYRAAYNSNTIFRKVEMPSTHLNPGLKSLAAYDSYNIFSNSKIFSADVSKPTYDVPFSL
jgi:hypothetical protein